MANRKPAAEAAIDINSAMRNMAEQMVQLNQRMEKFAEQARKAAPSLSQAKTLGEFVRARARDAPYAPIADVLAEFDNLYARDLVGKSAREVGDWIFTQEHILELVTDNKIRAIKEVRAIAGLGLKEAKDAVDYAAADLARGRIPEYERERLERDAEQAIRSILGISGE